MVEKGQVRIPAEDPEVIAAIVGAYDENLDAIEKGLGVKVVVRGGNFVVTGAPDRLKQAEEVFARLKSFYKERGNIAPQDVNCVIDAVRTGFVEKLDELAREVLLTTPRGKQVRPKTMGQQRYVQAMRESDIVFAIGPAGTGKTYLAVVMAVRALREKAVGRLILTRPAVEAGEKLGFLPGDIQEKVDPYLRPLYDSLYDVLGVENTQRYLDRHVIEIAPLAYMRGRTLEDAFIILDEAQNTTPEQMKMFLTRLGFSSRAVVTGDVTQIDLPRGQVSGLVDAERKLAGVAGISFVYLTGADTIRHPLVIEIIRAYERAEAEAKE